MNSLTKDRDQAGLWLHPWLHHPASKQSAPRSPECEQFLGTFWPASMDYASPLAPIFLAECMDEDLLARRPVWQVRDGLIPLLWFFELFPKPKTKNFKTKLLVSETLEGYIPAPWREHFGTFRVVSRAKQPEAPAAKRLLLTSVVAESYCSLDSLSHQLETLKSQLNSVKFDEKVEHLAFFSVHSEPGSALPSSFLTSVAQAVPGKIRCIDWTRFNGLDSLQDTYVVEFNDHLLCGDGYLSHIALSAGATFIDPKQTLGSLRDLKAGEGYVELSPYHGVLVKNEISVSSELELALKKRDETSPHFRNYLRAVRSRVNQRYPWPKWMLSWSKAHQGNKK